MKKKRLKDKIREKIFDIVTGEDDYDEPSYDINDAINEFKSDPIGFLFGEDDEIEDEKEKSNIIKVDFVNKRRM